MGYALAVLHDGTRPAAVMDNAMHTLVSESHRLASVIGTAGPDTTGLSDDPSILTAQIGRMIEQVRRQFVEGFDPRRPGQMPRIIGRLSSASELLFRLRGGPRTATVPQRDVVAAPDAPVAAVAASRRPAAGLVAAVTSALWLILGPMMH